MTNDPFAFRYHHCKWVFGTSSLPFACQFFSNDSYPHAFISMVASHHHFDAELHAEFPSSRHFRVVHMWKYRGCGYRSRPCHEIKNCFPGMFEGHSRKFVLMKISHYTVNSSVFSHFLSFALMTTGAFSRNISRVTFQAPLVTDNLTLYLAMHVHIESSVGKSFILLRDKYTMAAYHDKKTENHHGTLTTQDIPLFMRIRGPIASGCHFPKSNWGGWARQHGKPGSWFLRCIKAWLSNFTYHREDHGC